MSLDSRNSTMTKFEPIILLKIFTHYSQNMRPKLLFLLPICIFTNMLCILGIFTVTEEI